MALEKVDGLAPVYDWAAMEPGTIVSTLEVLQKNRDERGLPFLGHFPLASDGRVRKEVAVKSALFHFTRVRGDGATFEVLTRLNGDKHPSSMGPPVELSPDDVEAFRKVSRGLSRSPVLSWNQDSFRIVAAGIKLLNRGENIRGIIRPAHMPIYANVGIAGG